MYCWQECKLPPRGIVQRFLKKLKIELHYDPTIPILSMYPEKTSLKGCMLCNVCVSRSVVSDSLQPHELQPWNSLSMEFSRQEYQSGCHSLLQRILPTQALIPGLLLCRQILYRLSYQEVLKRGRSGCMGQKLNPGLPRGRRESYH